MIFTGWDYPRDSANNALVGSLDDDKAHYAKLGEQFGVVFVPPPEIVDELGYRDLDHSKFDEALAAFRFNTETYPRWMYGWDSLGGGLERAGKLEEAAVAYRKAVALAKAAHDSALETFRGHEQRLAARLKGSAK